MTLLAYRPDLAIALADESPSSGLADDTRDELSRIAQQIVTLVAPLKGVRSLSTAERLVSLAVPDYALLAKQVMQVLSRSDAFESARRMPRSLNDSIRESTLVSEDVKEQLQGVLESMGAYMDWFRRDYAWETNEGRQRALSPLVNEVNDHLTRVEVAFTAISLVLHEPPDSTADAIPILAELVDRCWTEVEDALMSLAEYDDTGETIPLSEVKAELGL